MKFSTDEINVFGGMLQLQMPVAAIDDVHALQKYCAKGKRITVEIKRERRSNDANSLAWVLCHEIAKKLSTGKLRLSKEDVYRKAIMDCGHCTILPIKEAAVESFKRIWQGHGIGWVTEDLGESKLKGYVNIAAYHGSSTYDTKEMTRLIDGLLQECESLGIQTKPSAEIESLLREWGEKNG
jgi:PIN domain nuclease of toxin-antitoxin system